MNFDSNTTAFHGPNALMLAQAADLAYAKVEEIKAQARNWGSIDSNSFSMTKLKHFWRAMRKG